MRIELQKLGADLLIRSNKGATCKSLALRMEQKEIVDWLKEFASREIVQLPRETAPPSYEEVMQDRDINKPWTQSEVSSTKPSFPSSIFFFECKAVFNAAKHGNLKELQSYIEAGAPRISKTLIMEEFSFVLSRMHSFRKSDADIHCFILCNISKYLIKM